MIQQIFRSPIPVLAILCIALLADGTGIVRLSLAASVVHELGHCAVYFLQTGKPPKLQFDLCGIGLNVQQLRQSRFHQTLLLLAGPAANLMLCAVIFFLIQQKATYARYFFLVSNLVCACYNLLPIGVLDGARLLQLWIPLRFEKYVRLLEQMMGFFLVGWMAYSLLGQMPIWAAVIFFAVFAFSILRSMAQR